MTTLIGDKLRGMRNRASIADMADQLGVAPNTLGDYERGKRLPDIDFLIRFAAQTKSDLLELLQLRVADSPESGDIPADFLPAPASVLEDEFVRIPFYDVDLGAGNSQFVDAEKVKSHLAFRRDWLKEMGLQVKMLALANTRGPSMSPTLESGDTVLLDLRKTAIVDDDIYAIRLDGQLLIKRMQRLPDGKVKVISDNPAYDPFVVELSRFDGGENAVVGLYVWHGHVNRSVMG